jgi:multicomponent Na+:H+ antiporter subunit D
MSSLLVLPIVIPLAAAALALIGWHVRWVQRAAALAGTAALLVVSVSLFGVVTRDGIQSTQLGNWPAPFGITLVADQFSAIMVVITGFMGLAVTCYSFATIDRRREETGYYFFLLILLMGVCGAFLTGDLFNLYVWFEVLLMASFVLLALGGGREQMEGAIKYVTLNLVSSAFFLAGAGILYGLAGTLNLADLAVKLRETQETGLTTAVAMLFFVAFGIKAAAFPLFFWLPAAYHTPPVAITAIFSGLLTKVGVYSLVRTFTLLFVGDPGYTHNLILVIAGFTMVTGVLGAVAQYDFRRLLAFHIVSQIGYLLMGLGLFTAAALAGTVYFMVHVIIAKSALFLVSGVVALLRETYDLKKLGGLSESHPWVAVLFIVPALSLAGIPPLSGFFAKLALIRAGLEIEQYAIVAAALAVSILTLFSMTKIWAEAFWKEPPSVQKSGEPRRLSPAAAALLFGPMVIMALMLVAIGLGAESLFAMAMRAGEQLMDPGEYIDVVLGARQ